MPPAMLHEISRHKAPDVRLAVSRNTATKIDTLISLAEDKEAKIRAAAAPSLTARLSPTANTKPTSSDRKIISSLQKLAEDELAAVRRQVTSAMLDQNRPITVVTNILAQDLDRAVAEPILMGAPDIDDAILHKMLEHYPPGLEGILDFFIPIRDNEVVREAVGILAREYAGIETAGPTGAARFQDQLVEGSEEFEGVRRRAYEAIQYLVRGIQDNESAG